MPDISVTTGQEYYSGSYTAIRDLCKALNIGEGKLATITQALINQFQEQVDREIDGILEDMYWVPISPINQYQPDGTTKSIYPGSLRHLARYWAAGLLLKSQFQGVDPNTNEAAQSHIDDSRREVFKLRRMLQRMPGVRMKAGHMGHTMPPTMMPPVAPEQDW
jgi:hypothetical protein